MEVNINDFGDEVRRSVILKLLKLQELLIQNSLMEEKGEETIHVGPQKVGPETKHPKWETRFG